MTKDEWYRQLFERLDNSKFRSSFHLKQKDIDYINEEGLDTIRQHAKEFIAKREAPAYIANDGKQTLGYLGFYFYEIVVPQAKDKRFKPSLGVEEE